MDRIRLLLTMLIMIVVGTLVSAAQTINFKVDMTVLWGGTLPKSVYVLVNSPSNLMQKDSWRVNNVIKACYNSTYRDNGTEQAIADAIELRDTDYDGIYTGTVEYNASGAFSFDARLYIAKADVNNTMKNPIYEVNCNGVGIDYMGYRKINSTTLNWAWEEKAISGWDDVSSADPNTAGTQNMQSGFSKKLVLNASFFNDASVNREVGKYVVKFEGDETIAKIEKVIDDNGKGDVLYTKIVAVGVGSTVLKMRVGNTATKYKEFWITVNVTDATLNAGDRTVIVKPAGGILSTDSFGIDNNMYLVNSANPRQVALTSDTTNSIINSSWGFLDGYYFTVLTPSLGSGYSWWTPMNIASNGVIIPLTGINTGAKKTNYSGGVYFRGTPNGFDLSKTMTLVADYTREIKVTFGSAATERFKIDTSTNWTAAYPATDYYITGGAGDYIIRFNENTKAITVTKNGILTPTTFVQDVVFKKVDTLTSITTTTNIKLPTIASTMTVVTGANPVFQWEESQVENSNYTSRYTIARIFKIGTDSASVKYDPYNMKNPIIDAATNVNAVTDFDGGTTGYIDYVFSGVGTKISSDGRSVKKDEDTSEVIQKITVMDFPIGQYKIQIYSIKGNSASGYSVVSFEHEKAFEITKEDFEAASSSTDDSYIINGIDPSGFHEIAVTFTTRTQKIMTQTEMLTKVVYDGTNVGVKEYKRNGATNTHDTTGMNNTESVSGGGLISVTKLTNDKTSKFPLDIILCIDRSKSMNSKMAAFKTAWTNFESEMAQKGYDVGYKMVSFGGASYNGFSDYSKFTMVPDETAANWATNLSTAYSGNFDTNSEDGGWGCEQAFAAVNKSVEFFKTKGRYYGYNTTTKSWGATTTVTPVPSKRVIMFITDTTAALPGMSVNAFEEKIRAAKIQLIGIGAMLDTTGNKLFYDEYGIPTLSSADSSKNSSNTSIHNGNGGYGYYDLKILLGNQFRAYQATNDPAKLLGQMLQGMNGINSTAVWQLKYMTPYPECDRTYRRVDFDVKNSSGAIMAYKGTSLDRLYKAPQLTVYSEITNPTDNGVFEEATSGKYRIRGRAWGKMTFDDAAIDEKITTTQRYPDIKNCMLEIATAGAGVPVNLIKPGSATVLYSADFDHANRVTFGDGAVGFEYIFDVPSENIINTGAEEFDVKVTAYSIPKNGWSTFGVGTAIRVKADADPPIITDIKMVNTTVRDAMLAMRGSESSTGNIFNTDVEVLNTLWYKPYADTSLKSDSTSIVQPKFENRESKATYDGRFVKDGDVLKVTAVMYDQNFDDSAVTMITNNRIAATFTNLGVSGEVYPSVINIENVTIGGVASKKLTVTWNITVSNTNTTDTTKLTSIMKIKAIDKYGNSSMDTTKATNAIGDIEIAKIDNINPGYAEWESGKAVTNSAKADLTSFASKTAGAVITNQPYQLNCYAGAGTVDTNGIRAFKVYYTYDSTQSDWGSAGESTTGNHDADMHTIGTETIGYFYIKAGNDAINLSWNGTNETQLPASGYGVKTPNAGTSGDDGKYVFKVTAVDKAGNETYYSSTIKDFNISRIEDNAGVMPKIVYVDTQAPRITNIKLTRDVDTEEKLVKNGDKAYITATVTDFSMVTDGIDGTEATRKNKYYYIENLYPEYSGIIGVGAGSENPIFASSSINNTTNSFTLNIGESVSGIKPYILVSGEANKDYKTTIKVGAMDLAGNSVKAGNLADKTDSTNLEIEVDNVAPKPVKIKAIAKEGGLYGAPVIFSNTSETVLEVDKNIAVTHFTRNLDYWLKVIKVENDSDISPVIKGNAGEENEDVEKVHIYSNGIEQSAEMYSNGKIFYEVKNGKENEINTAYLVLEDKAGNKSSMLPLIISKIQDNIVIDKKVPNGNARTIFTGNIAKNISYDSETKKAAYEFQILIGGIPDYAGLQKLEVIITRKISGVEIIEEKPVTMYDNKVNNLPLIDINTNLRSLEGKISLNFGEGDITKYDIPFSKIGSYIDLKVKLYDNLGNTSIVTYRVLVPKVNVDIRAQQRGSDKEIRTKVDIMDAGGKVDLRKTEETGKKAKQTNQE